MSRPRPKGTARGHGLADQLREIIASRGLTAYGLGRDAGVDAGVIHRFLAGERDIRLETAGRIAAALGLRLVEVAGRRGKAPARPRARSADTPAVAERPPADIDTRTPAEPAGMD